MGRWLGDYFENQGHRVANLDPRASPDGRQRIRSLSEAAERSDVLVFATPIRTTAPLLRRAIALRSRALIFDVLSVKHPIASELRRGVKAGLRVSSAHPMFGPTARTLSGRNLLVVGCGNPEADREVRSLFEPTALSIAEIPLADHDRVIAESLGLSHAVNLLFLEALSDAPISRRDLGRAASTTFHGQCALARAVSTEGPGLYLDIQSTNPYSRRLYADLERSLKGLRQIVNRRDVAQFQRLLELGRGKLVEGPQAMRAG